MKFAGKTVYKLSVAVHFVITFLLIAFSIVSLVQGIKVHFEGNTFLALGFYIATPLMVFVSFLSYQKAHYKLKVLAKSLN